MIPQRRTDTIRDVAGDDAVGRFLLLGSTEYSVLQPIDGVRDTRTVREDFNRRSSVPLPMKALVRFLRSLDEASSLAGLRRQGPFRRDVTVPHLYVCFPFSIPKLS